MPSQLFLEIFQQKFGDKVILTSTIHLRNLYEKFRAEIELSLLSTNENQNTEFFKHFLRIVNHKLRKEKFRFVIFTCTVIFILCTAAQSCECQKI
jgi:hypothetical protein